jgi:hypothetical protein
MKHAGGDTLEILEPFLVQVRSVEGLSEKKQGIFYRRSKAFLHFHEDATGLFADLRCGERFERFPVSTKTQQTTFLVRVREEARG